MYQTKKIVLKNIPYFASTPSNNIFFAHVGISIYVNKNDFQIDLLDS